MDKKPRVICLMGPTGTGKTELALQLAQDLSCQIISVDSAMIYRGMSIGTAKPEPALLAAIPHHLIDICDPLDHYSVAQFCQDALSKIDTIIKAGDTPLLVGGTMLYFRALQKGLSPLPGADPAIRAQLQAEAQIHGWAELHKRLDEIDPQAAACIHPHDPQRIQRALEVFMISGKPMSEHWRASQDYDFPYEVLNVALVPQDRQILHDKIAQRFQDMLAKGFIAEVEHLYQRGDLSLQCRAMRAVGYRQVWQYLAGDLSKQDMHDKGIYATRQLAKRQLTWLRNGQLPNFHCVDPFVPDVSKMVTDCLREG